MSQVKITFDDTCDPFGCTSDLRRSNGSVGIDCVPQRSIDHPLKSSFLLQCPRLVVCSLISHNCPLCLCLDFEFAVQNTLDLLVEGTKKSNASLICFRVP
jgi:hypothetical protein